MDNELAKMLAEMIPAGGKVMLSHSAMSGKFVVGLTGTPVRSESDADLEVAIRKLFDNRGKKIDG
jgi:formamidopyrimidine-DNA glycosylase